MRSGSEVIRQFTPVLLASVLVACVSTEPQPEAQRPSPQVTTLSTTAVSDESGFLPEPEEAAQSLPPEALPAEPGLVYATVDSLLADARLLVQQQQMEQAAATLRQALLLEAEHPEARSLLVDLLIQQDRAAEAVVLMNSRRGSGLNVVGFERLLAALQSAGATYELAMTAEEAVAAYPERVGFLTIAVEALLDVEAHDQAWGYWARVPQAERETPHAQWLLGRMHEVRDQPALAWGAYQQAAPLEARAAEALLRLEGQRLMLGGWHYFVAPQWVVLSAAEGLLLDTSSGAQASVRIVPAIVPVAALEQALSQSLPLAPEDLSALLAGKVASDPEDWIQLATLSCSSAEDALCVHAGPSSGFAGLFPDIYLVAIQAGNDVLLVSVEAGSREESVSALELLGRQTWLARGE